jgi:hypothetical protein
MQSKSHEKGALVSYPSAVLYPCTASGCRKRALTISLKRLHRGLNADAPRFRHLGSDGLCFVGLQVSRDKPARMKLQRPYYASTTDTLNKPWTPGMVISKHAQLAVESTGVSGS